MTNSEYGQRLRDLRAELGLSLREVEERGGPSKDVLSPIERGVHKPRAQTLGKIAKAFGMSVADLRAELEGQGALAAGPLGDPLAHPEAQEWLREHENWRLYMPYEAWARDVAKMNVLDVRKEWHRLVGEEDTLWREDEIEKLAKRIRHSGKTREEVLAAHNRASEIKSALRKDMRRRFMRRIVAAANFETFLEAEAVAGLDEKLEALLRVPEDIHS